jgi:hypothetical protein
MSVDDILNNMIAGVSRAALEEFINVRSVIPVDVKSNNFPEELFIV